MNNFISKDEKSSRTIVYIDPISIFSYFVFFK